MNQKTIKKPTKYIRSRTLGDIRAQKEMKSFCAGLKAFDNPMIVCKEFWMRTLHMASRDTKLYYRALARELFDFIQHLSGWVDSQYLIMEADRYLDKFEMNDF